MKINLLGVKIDALTKQMVLDKIEKSFDNNSKIFIVTPYSEIIVAAQKDPELREILNSADIALPDGIGILWAAKYLKLDIKNQIAKIWYLILSLLAIIFSPKYISDPIPEKISGSEFIWDLAELAATNNFSIFLLGGFNDTPALAAEKLKQKLPTLKVAGVSSRHPQEEGIVQKINGSGADFLFVAFGPIKQEKWIFRNRLKLKSRVVMGVGGTFDYLAGIKPYRPKKWALRGLEWLWRLITQPSRILRIAKGVCGLIYHAFLFKLK